MGVAEHWGELITKLSSAQNSSGQHSTEKQLGGCVLDSSGGGGTTKKVGYHYWRGVWYSIQGEAQDRLRET